MTTQNSTENTASQSIAKSNKTTAVRQSRWQLLVISGTTANALAQKNIRFDSAQALNAPHIPLGWSQQVGWHSALASSPAFPQVNAPISHSAIAPHGKIIAPKFLMAGKPQIAVGMPMESHVDIEHRLLELARQLAKDISGPLAASHQIVTSISSQARVNSYLSIDDAQQLSTVSRNLELISQWTECILLSRKAEGGGLQVIRSRFSAAQWRESIVGVLEAIAKPKNIKINWIGWDSELPLLYLDPHHLTRAVFNLVANAIAASEPNETISIRASWQHNVTGRLMITIEDNGIGLPPTLMKLLNSAAANSHLPNNGSGLQAARQLISGIGGLIAAQHGPRRGTIVRISLPVDSYGSLIRAWILQNATLATSSARYSVALFAVRCGQMESDLFDSHLQTSATVRQFVYRVANNRWLVLELKSSQECSDSTLMAAAEQLVPARLQDSQPWLSQSVFVTPAFTLGGLLGRTDGDLRLPQLTEQLVEKFEELLNFQQPAIDRLTISESVVPTPHLKRHQLSPSSTKGTVNNPTSGQGEPGAQTVSEIVKQWKLVQAKMALNDHPALTR